MEKANNALKLIARTTQLLYKYLEENDIYNDVYITESIKLLQEALDKLGA